MIMKYVFCYWQFASRESKWVNDGLRWISHLARQMWKITRTVIVT